MCVIAISSSAVIVSYSANRCAGQAIAVPAGFELAWFTVGISARPTGVRRLTPNVPHREKVTRSVVKVALKVCAHGVAVVGGPINADARGIVVGMRNRRAAHLPQVLAAGRLDQPVDGIVGIVCARLDA